MPEAVSGIHVRKCLRKTTWMAGTSPAMTKVQFGECRRLRQRGAAMNLEIFTLRERPELRPQIFSAAFRPPFWPEFLLHDSAARLYFDEPHFAAHEDYAFA